jgi:hypothetical protein
MRKRKTFKQHARDNAAGYSIGVGSAIILLACALLPGYLERAAERRAEQRIERQYEAPERFSAPLPDIAPEPTPAAIPARKPKAKRQSLAEAQAAKKGILDRSFEIRSGYCSRFVRQVVQKSQGSRFNHLFGPTSTDTTWRFVRAGYAFKWPENKARLGGVIKPGDILFKVKDRFGRPVARGYGHVGIYAGNNLVAENSSTSKGRIQGAKGYRTLAEYGYFDYVGRLPDPVKNSR